MSSCALAPTRKAASPTLTAAPAAVLQRSCDCGQHTVGGEECKECKKKQTSLQRYSNGVAGPMTAPPIVHEVLRSSGQPLDAATRAFFEPRFGHDFSRVRVHSDALASASARAVNALAYTVGNDVVFGVGRYASRSGEGKRLLAHELTHVVQQQNADTASVQRRLEVGPVQDRFEQEAEQSAERVTGEVETSPEAGSNPALASATARVQRAVAAEPGGDAAGAETASPNRAAATLLVEDDAQDLRPGQMRKGQFLNKLQVAVCATADEVLVSVGRTAQGCPYIERWIGHLHTKSSEFVERGVRKYAPDSAGVTSAEGYLPFVAARVRRGVMRWARTGEITEVPDELKGQLLAASALGAVEGLVSKIGGAIAGAASAVAGGVKKAESAIGGLFAKGREGGVRDAGNPHEIQAQLGSGHPLDSGIKWRMERSFGGDFSQVRVHADSTAAGLSTALNARAFTIGRDVAFGAGEYQPGTLIGDALIAHELAHVVQQGDGVSAVSPMSRGTTEYNALEEDADVSAIGTVLSLWGETKGTLKTVGQRIGPSLRSGLRLQRCGGKTPTTTVPTQKAAATGEKAEGGTTPGEKPEAASVRHDAFGKECPDTIEIAELKPIPAFDQRMFDAGYRTYFGTVSNMRVGPKDSYEACITEVLSVKEDGCGDKGNMAQTTHCGENKPCMQVNKDCGGDPDTSTTFPCSPNTFVDRHRTAPKEKGAKIGLNLMEGTGKTECRVMCLQRYACGGKEIGRFLIIRKYKAETFSAGNKKVPITTGTMEKVPAKK